MQIREEEAGKRKAQVRVPALSISAFICLHLRFYFLLICRAFHAKLRRPGIIRRSVGASFRFLIRNPASNEEARHCFEASSAPKILTTSWRQLAARSSL